MKTLILIIIGALSGAINGFLGTGGGIAVIFALNLLFPKLDARDRFASAIAVILPMSTVSAVMYSAGGNLPTEQGLVYLIPAAIGGYAGARALDKINTAWLNRIFAVLLIFAGSALIFR